MAKKKSRNLEKKEHALYSFVIFIHCITIQAIETGKSVGANIVSYIACAVLLCGVYMKTKYYKELKKESSDLKVSNRLLMFLGITVIFYAVASFLVLLR